MKKNEEFTGLEIARLVLNKLSNDSLQNIALFFEAQISDTATVEDVKKLSSISSKKCNAIICAANKRLYVNSLIGLSECQENIISNSLKRQMKADNFCIGRYLNDYYIVFESIDKSDDSYNKEINQLLINEYQKIIGNKDLIKIYTTADKIQQFNNNIVSDITKREYITNYSQSFSSLLQTIIDTSNFQLMIEYNSIKKTAIPKVLIDGEYTLFELEDHEQQDIYQDIRHFSTLINFELNIDTQPINGSLFMLLENKEYKLKISSVPLENCTLIKCIIESTFNDFNALDRMPETNKLTKSFFETRTSTLFNYQQSINEQILNLSIISKINEIAKETEQLIIIDSDAQELVNENDMSCKIANIDGIETSSIIAVNPLAIYFGNINNESKRSRFIELANNGISVIGFCSYGLDKVIQKKCLNELNLL